MRSGRARGVVLAVLTCVLLLAGCAPLPWQSAAMISGTIEGMSVTSALAGKSQLAGIGAQVSCNGNSTLADASGRFRLSVVRASSYPCSVTASGFANATLTIPGGGTTALTLDLTSGAAHCASTGTRTTCPALSPEPGTLAGSVRDAHGAPVGGVRVSCEDAHGPPYVTPLVATTDASGAYTLARLPVATYGCFAYAPDGSSTYHQVAVPPNQQAHQDFTLCTNACQRVHYHVGPVMHAQQVYLIFWQPSGTSFDPSGDVAYEQDMAQYFRDIGNTPFFAMLSQYSDYQSPITGQVEYATTVVDHTPFENCYGYDTPCSRVAASTSAPLNDFSLQAEIQHIINRERWPITDNMLVYLYLPIDAQACGNTVEPQSDCSFPKGGGQAFCAYHSQFVNDQNTNNIDYAIVADPLTDSGCNLGIGAAGVAAPHGSWVADSAILSGSHEQFEAATDPAGDAWYADGSANPNGNEIGDLCEDSLPPLNADGTDVRLHGHGYYLQAEWSNSAHRCVLPS